MSLREIEWPDATVAILLHEPGERELRTVEIVRAQQYTGAVSILGIDSSADPTSSHSAALHEAVDEWCSIAPTSFSHGGTRNLAVDRCRTGVIAFLSQDAHPLDERWLQELVRPLADGRAVASYGRQIPWSADAERQATFRFLYPETPEVKSKEQLPEMGLRTFHFSDVTSAFKTDVLRADRFPADLPIFEDVAVAKSLLDAGLRIAYVPAAAVYHSHRLGIRHLVKRYSQIGAIYEQLGIFSELRRCRQGGLLFQGMSAARAMAPESKGLGNRIRAALLGGLKIASVAAGRWRARLLSGLKKGVVPR